MRDYYSILQIEEDATQDEVKQAYHKMARLFHPDNFKGSQEDVAEHMSKINEAYQTLSDMEKRAVYDAERKLRYGKSDQESNPKDTREEKPKTDSVNTSPKTTESAYANVKETKRSPKDNATKKSSSSCLAKIIEWAIYIGIIYFLISHFHLIDKAKSLLNTSIPSQQRGIEKGNADKQDKLNPEDVVEKYFKCLKEGNSNEANKLFSKKADKKFQTCTVAEYNQVIVDLYYGFDESIPTYPLFEEIRKFNFDIVSTNIDEKNEYADVSLEIENCDVALLFGMILESDSGNKLQTLSDSKPMLTT